MLDKFIELEGKYGMLGSLIGIAALMALFGFILLCANALVKFSLEAFLFIFNTFFSGGWHW